MKLAIYDFDGTLCEKETLPFIFRYYKKNNYSFWKILRFYFKIITFTLQYKLISSFDKEKYRACAATSFMYLFEDMDKDEVTKFFFDCADEISQYFNPSVLDSIQMRKNEGYQIVLCSGANEIFLDAVARHTDIDITIGTELFFREDGSYNFDMPISVTTGKNKPIALKKRFKDVDVDWASSYGYGDSYYDSEFMKLTGHPVAVNPDDRLREIAVENGWGILEN